MDQLLASGSLWAMHPAFLDALLKRNTIEAMLPDALKKLAGFGAPIDAKAADPIREGATAIVPIVGTLAPSGLYPSRTPTDVLAQRMRELAADAKVGAIVLDVKSPGGLVWGTQEAGDAIYEARQSKPVIAVASPIAFSAAHWLATQATAFYASPSADVGSVGVRSGHVDQSGFEQKIGIITTPIASHPDKIAGHPYAPLSEEDRAAMQSGVDEAAQSFIAAIARGRGMRASDVPGVHGNGGVFSAAEAAARGVTDGVMTLRDVVAKYSSSRSRLDLMRRRAALAADIADI